MKRVSFIAALMVAAVLIGFWLTTRTHDQSLETSDSSATDPGAPITADAVPAEPIEGHTDESGQEEPDPDLALPDLSGWTDVKLMAYLLYRSMNFDKVGFEHGQAEAAKRSNQLADAALDIHGLMSGVTALACSREDLEEYQSVVDDAGSREDVLTYLAHLPLEIVMSTVSDRLKRHWSLPLEDERLSAFRKEFMLWRIVKEGGPNSLNEIEKVPHRLFSLSDLLDAYSMKLTWVLAEALTPEAAWQAGPTQEAVGGHFATLIADGNLGRRLPRDEPIMKIDHCWVDGVVRAIQLRMKGRPLPDIEGLTAVFRRGIFPDSLLVNRASERYETRLYLDFLHVFGLPTEPDIETVLTRIRSAADREERVAIVQAFLSHPPVHPNELELVLNALQEFAGLNVATGILSDALDGIAMPTPEEREGWYKLFADIAAGSANGLAMNATNIITTKHWRAQYNGTRRPGTYEIQWKYPPKPIGGASGTHLVANLRKHEAIAALAAVELILESGFPPVEKAERLRSYLGSLESHEIEQLHLQSTGFAWRWLAYTEVHLSGNASLQSITLETVNAFLSRSPQTSTPTGRSRSLASNHILGLVGLLKLADACADAGGLDSDALLGAKRKLETYLAIGEEERKKYTAEQWLPWVQAYLGN